MRLWIRYVVGISVLGFGILLLLDSFTVDYSQGTIPLNAIELFCAAVAFFVSVPLVVSAAKESIGRQGWKPQLLQDPAVGRYLRFLIGPPLLFLGTISLLSTLDWWTTLLFGTGFQCLGSATAEAIEDRMASRAASPPLLR